MYDVREDYYPRTCLGSGKIAEWITTGMQRSTVEYIIPARMQGKLNNYAS